MNLPNRKNIRLMDFDYSSSGAYFTTVCVQGHKHILSKISVGDGSPVPELTSFGKAVDDAIRMIPGKYPHFIVDKYVIMPNHVHILMRIANRFSRTGDPSPTVSDVVAWFKYHSTVIINNMRKTPGEKVWQRSFYDHIIRGQQDYEEIWMYIDANPLRWNSDRFNSRKTY